MLYYAHGPKHDRYRYAFPELGPPSLGLEMVFRCFRDVLVVKKIGRSRSRSRLEQKPMSRFRSWGSCKHAEIAEGVSKNAKVISAVCEPKYTKF